MTIAIGSDHGGFLMKEALKNFLGERDTKLSMLGTDSEQRVIILILLMQWSSLVGSHES